MIVDLHTSMRRLEHWEQISSQVEKLGLGTIVVKVDRPIGNSKAPETKVDCVLFDAFALTESDLIERLHTLQKAAGAPLILIAPAQTSKQSLALFEGILCIGQLATETIQSHWLGPVQTLKLRLPDAFELTTDAPYGMSMSEAKLFIESISALLTSINEWRQILPLCDLLASEANFLGISGRSPVIEAVSCNLDMILTAPV